MAEIAVKEIILPQAYKFFEGAILRDADAHVAHANPAVLIDIKERGFVQGCLQIDFAAFQREHLQAAFPGFPYYRGYTGRPTRNAERLKEQQLTLLRGRVPYRR